MKCKLSIQEKLKDLRIKKACLYKNCQSRPEYPGHRLEIMKLMITKKPLDNV